MSSKNKTIATKDEARPALVPKLRFPGFQNAGEWAIDALGQLADYENGKAYEQDIVENGKYVVVNSRFISTDGAVRKHTNAEYLIAKAGEVLMVLSDLPKGRALAKCYFVESDDRYAVNQRVCRLKPRRIDGKFLYYTLNRHPHLLAYDDGLNQTHLSKGGVTECPLRVPTQKAEQQKIAECLSSVDELMAAQARKVDALKTHKKGLMQQLFPREGETQPRLRFPEFQNAGEWEKSTVEELIVTVTPPKKLQTPDYQPEGEFPIVDQSQDYICGWTNDGEAVIDKGLPVIVFGDHTCALKFIDQPFAQGADGIKILRPKRGIDIRFLFCALAADPVVQESYKRHFSMLKEKKLSYPDPKSGEQQRIASCLSSLNALITLESQKLEALRTHKKGLMQQLFPSPDEVEV